MRRLLRSRSSIVLLVVSAIASVGTGTGGGRAFHSKISDDNPHWTKSSREGLRASSMPTEQISAAVPAVLSQEAYLKASRSRADNQFGSAVGMSGDTLVVGAPGESSSATGVNGDADNTSAPFSGAAYVFVRTGGVWTQQAYLKASNTGFGDAFGYSVSISGDTIVVGAPYEDSSSTGINGNAANNATPDSGAAYVFVRSSGVWTQQAYIKASNTGSGDRFGYSVSLSNDTIVIGADSEDSSSTGVNGSGANNSAESAGAAYVFLRNSGTWAQQAYLKASNTGAGDSFGWSVGVSGDTIIVGSPNESSAATGIGGDGLNDDLQSSGAAYAFVRSGTNWTQQAYFKSPSPDENDFFGYSVAISGSTVVVGVVNEDSSSQGVNGDPADDSAMDSGAAFVFVSSNGLWNQEGYLKTSNAGPNDFFGASIAISGDTIVVGAPYESSAATGVNGNGSDNSAADAGAAYQFQRAAGIWNQVAYIKASNTATSDRFGYAVTASNTVAVGAIGESSAANGVNGNQSDDSAIDAGAAYSFSEGGLQPLSLSVGGSSIASGSSGSVSITFLSQGNENNLGFSLTFDTSRLTYLSATAGASLPAGANVVFNSSQVASGRLGVTVTLPAGQSFTAGPHQLLTLNLSVPGSAPQGVTTVAFGDTPVARSVVRPNGVSVPLNQVTFSSGVVTITPPVVVRSVRVVGTTIQVGSNGSIGIEIDSQGTENGFTFSLNFDPTRLTYSSAELGSGAPVGASLNINTTILSSGMLGVAFDLPAGSVLLPGTQRLVNVIFQVPPAVQSGETTITFADSPIPRELLDLNELTLPASYTSGIVTIDGSGLEADTAPRPNGNGVVSLIDWVQTGRLAVGLDTISPGSEYQRADCAPRDTKGNGQLSLADWVQAGRYGSRLDPVVSVGGPTGPVPFTESSSSNVIASGLRSPTSPSRVVSIVTHVPARSEASHIEIWMEATGIENAISLTLSFDPSEWNFIDVRPGSDSAEATLIFKSFADGRISIAMALAPGQSLKSGARNLIDVTLGRRSGAQQRLPILDFSDDAQVKAEIVDVDGNPISGQWLVPGQAKRIR